MPQKHKAELMAAMRKRRREAGLVQKTVYIHVSWTNEDLNKAVSKLQKVKPGRKPIT